MANSITFTQLGWTGVGPLVQSGPTAFNKSLPFGAIDSTITDTTTLANPPNAYYFIDMSADGKQVNLMPMNETNSPSLGSLLIFDNDQAGKAVDIFYNDGTTPIFVGLQPNQLIVLTPVANTSSNGAFRIVHISTISSAFLTDASGIWSATQPVSIKYNYDGNTVTLLLSETFATANTAAKITLVDHLPSFLRPLGKITDFISVQSNTTQAVGICVIDTDGSVTIGSGVNNGNFTGAGTGGFYCKSYTYDISS